jgi:primary-amine oxidase
MIGILALAAATVVATESARAACTDPTETFVTTVTRTFTSGSSWSIGVSRRACEGLAIGPVFFTPAGGASTEVLFRGTISEVHVPYHSGSPRFLDVTASTNGLGVGAVPLAAAECGGTLFDGNRICVQNDDGGYGWKFNASFRTAQAIEIFMSSQLGQYNYINKWTFHDDGVIEPQVGLTGRLQSFGSGAAYLPYGTQLNKVGLTPLVGKSHMHNFYYRLDFDIGGSGNDAVSRLAFNPSAVPSPDSSCANPGECGITTLTQILTEQAQVFSTIGQTSWVVFDKALVNADGRSIGYEIEPKITGLWRGMTSTTEPWSNGDLWVTTYDGCERYAAENFAPHLDAVCTAAAPNLSAMLNGASVDGADLVVWYANRFQHVTRDENETNMPIEWTGFSIEPRSFYFQNPSP